MTRPPDPVLPFRWDLTRREQLGRLLESVRQPSVSWLERELVECAAKVLARCDDGDLFFVGRSAESLFDFLSGALGATPWRARLHLLPFSMRFVDRRELTRRAVSQLRANLRLIGLAPAALASRKRKITFVDLVATGSTYENLAALLHAFVIDEAVSWNAVRKKIRFIGITSRKKTSPNTLRWQQHAKWVHLFPARAIINVSVTPDMWSYFGNYQPKLTESFPHWRWSSPPEPSPRHDAPTLAALAEAVAIYDAGRAHGSAIARKLAREPAIKEPWLRALALGLTRTTDSKRR